MRQTTYAKTQAILNRATTAALAQNAVELALRNLIVTCNEQGYELAGYVIRKQIEKSEAFHAY